MRSHRVTQLDLVTQQLAMFEQLTRVLRAPARARCHSQCRIFCLFDMMTQQHFLVYFTVGQSVGLHVYASQLAASPRRAHRTVHPDTQLPSTTTRVTSSEPPARQFRCQAWIAYVATRGFASGCFFLAPERVAAPMANLDAQLTPGDIVHDPCEASGMRKVRIVCPTRRDASKTCSPHASEFDAPDAQLC